MNNLYMLIGEKPRRYWFKASKIVFVLLTAIFFLVVISASCSADIEALEPTLSQFPILKGDVPDLYTGDLHLNFDLMTVPGRSGLDYPIDLHYASGIHVEDEGSWIGLGWNLVPGEIVRSVVREPDDSPNGWMNNPLCGGGEYDPDCDHYRQDKYYLNLGGGFQKIMIDTSEDAYCHRWKAWKIEYDVDTSDGIDWWRVIKDDGTIYEFNKPVEADFTSYNNWYEWEWVPIEEDWYNKSHTYYSSWLLTAIKSNDYYDKTGDGCSPDDYGSYVNFIYSLAASDVTYWYPSDGGYLGRGIWQTRVYYNDPWYVYLDECYKSSTSLDFWYLDTIQTPVASARFVTEPRLDMMDETGTAQAQRLSRIELFLSPNPVPGEQVVKAVYFDNDNYTLCSNAPGSPSGRLTLAGFTEYGAYTGSFSTDLPHLNPTRFEYGYNPPYHRWAADDWGYYNGRTSNNGELFVGASFLPGDDRYPADDAQAWSLTRIVHPTGGWVEYSYEVDTYSYEQARDLGDDWHGGGIRVKSMTVSDGLNSPSETQFLYDRKDRRLCGDLVFVADYGSSPWGHIRDFSDSSAKWIWKYDDAWYDAPEEEFWVNKSFYSPTEDTITITITVDNYYELYVDETLIGSNTNWHNAETWTTSISEGEHYLKILVGNTLIPEHNPAGLLVSVKNSSGGIMFNTQGDGTWQWHTEGYEPVLGDLVFVTDFDTLLFGDIEGFSDSSAKWIWKYDDAWYDAPEEEFWVNKSFYSPTEDTITITITVDNYYELYVDETLIGSNTNWHNAETWTTSISEGEHYLKILVGNTLIPEHNPAGSPVIKLTRENNPTDLLVRKLIRGNNISGSGHNPAGLLVSVTSSSGGIMFNTQGDETGQRHNDESELSSGVALVRPVIAQDNEYGDRISSRNAFINAGVHEETQINYAKVTIVREGLGMTVTEFITAKDYDCGDADFNIYNRPFTFHDWKRGQIKNELIFNESGFVVAEKHFEYTRWTDHNYHYFNSIYAIIGLYGLYYEPIYNVVSGWTTLDQQVEMLDGVSKITNFSYNTQNGRVREQTEYSSGSAQTRSTRFVYGFEAGSAPEYTRLLDKNMLVSVYNTTVQNEHGDIKAYEYSQYQLEPGNRVYKNKTLKWLDTNRDGILDEGDSYIAETSINLFDDYGNQLQTEDANGAITDYTYLPSTSQLETQTVQADGKTYISTVSYDPVFTNQPQVITGSDDVSKTFTYDDFGRLSSVTPLGGTTTSYTYTEVSGDITSSNLNEIQTMVTGEGIDRNSVDYFDGLGQKVIERRDGPAGMVMIQTVYDKWGRANQTSLPFITGSIQAGDMGPHGYSKTVYYPDSLERVNMFYPNYDKNEPIKTETFYENEDSSTFKVTTVDPMGYQTVKYTDALGLFSRVEREGVTTQADNDILGNEILVTDATGKITKFFYDTLGRKIASRRPDMNLFSMGLYSGLGDVIEEGGYDEGGADTGSIGVYGSSQIVYVDDDAPNDPGPNDPDVSDPLENGSIDHPFDMIQEGINAVAEGGTVIVREGFYEESVEVDKTINLIGEDRDTTIINGGETDDTIRITADNVTINGFTLQLQHAGWQDAAIYVESYNNIITGNNIINNDYGISLPWWSRNNTISDNIVSNNYRGIYIRASVHHNIFGNIITNNSDGIYLNEVHSTTISGNIISENDNGIRLFESFDNVISGNKIINNEYDGIRIEHLEYSCNYNTIIENIIQGNDVGINSSYPGSSAVSDNSIYHNNFINNNQNAYDDGTNFWDDGYPSGGNYWDDYEGVDVDPEDGIGDSLYPIPGGSNQDRYPLIAPWLGDVTEKWEYDDAGNIVRYRDSNLAQAGTYITFEYDELGRETSRQVNNDPTTRINTVYDEYPLGVPSPVRSDINIDRAKAKITYIENEMQKEVLYYNDRGLLAEKHILIDDVDYRFEYEYNQAGEIIEKTIDPANNVTANFTYNMLGLVESVDLLKDGVALNVVIGFTYKPDGQMESITRSQNGVTTTYGYDELQRLNLSDTEGVEGLGFDRFFEYDNLGRITGIYDGTDISGKRIGNFSGVDAYDPFGRLTNGVIDSAVTSKPRRLCYSYDAVGNRLSRSEFDDLTSTYVGVDAYSYCNGTNRLKMVYHDDGSVSEFSYDGNGNIVRAMLHPGKVLDLGFNEGEGDIAYDSSYYENHGTLKDDNHTNEDGNTLPQWVTGHDGSGFALCFDGEDDYVEVPYDPSLNIQDELTISAWIKLNSYDEHGGIVGKAGYSYYLNIHSWRIGFGLWDDSAHGVSWPIPVDGFVGEWHHVVASWDGSVMRLFVDGDEKASGTFIGQIRTPEEPVILGQWPDWHDWDDWDPRPNLDLDGVIDDVRIYNKGLTVVDLSKIVDFGLNEGEGDIAHDSSYYENHGVIYGAQWVTGHDGSDYALSFDGFDDYVEVSDDISLNFDGSFTVAAWVKTDDGVSHQGIMDKFNSNPSGFYMRIWYDNYQFLVANGTNNFFVAADKTPYIGKWTHLMGVYDAPANEIRFYINGELKGTATAGYTPATNRDLLIGRTGGSANNVYWDGTIDNVKVLHGALTYEVLAAPPSYEYDFYGNLIKVNLPDKTCESYYYNYDGKRVKKVDVSDEELVYFYDRDAVVFDRKVSGLLAGDANGDVIVDVGDVVYLVTYLFRDGSPPIPKDCVGDCNNDGIVNLGDVLYLINYLFREGPPPVLPEGCSINTDTAYLSVGGVRLLSIRNGNLENINYFLTDQVGSSSVVVDSSGEEIGRQEYYPFGMTFVISGENEKYQFTGKEHDETTELYYYGARFYNPSLGRFTARDTVDDPGNNNNPYAYVNNNPLTRVDPTGNIGIEWYEWYWDLTFAAYNWLGKLNMRTQFAVRELERTGTLDPVVGHTIVETVNKATIRGQDLITYNFEVTNVRAGGAANFILPVEGFNAGASLTYSTANQISLSGGLGTGLGGAGLDYSGSFSYGPDGFSLGMGTSGAAGPFSLGFDDETIPIQATLPLLFIPEVGYIGPCFGADLTFPEVEPVYGSGYNWWMPEPWMTELDSLYEPPLYWWGY